MIHFNKLLAPNQGPLMVMCSGGVDSIAAAHFLWKANKEIEIFHFNHKLRQQNVQMEHAVRMFCADHQIEMHTFVAPNSEICSTEYGAHTARFAALDEACNYPDSESLGPLWRVICCHHLDDCVESYLMNCFNGVGEYSPIPIETARNACIVYRPFLMSRKVDFEKYAQQHGLYKYVVEDETNGDFNIRRNFVRHELRPLIETRWAGLEKVVKKKIISEYRKREETGDDNGKDS